VDRIIGACRRVDPGARPTALDVYNAIFRSPTAPPPGVAAAGAPRPGGAATPGLERSSSGSASAAAATGTSAGDFASGGDRRAWRPPARASGLPSARPTMLPSFVRAHSVEFVLSKWLQSRCRGQGDRVCSMPWECL